MRKRSLSREEKLREGLFDLCVSYTVERLRSVSCGFRSSWQGLLSSLPGIAQVPGVSPLVYWVGTSQNGGCHTEECKHGSREGVVMS